MKIPRNPATIRAKNAVALRRPALWKARPRVTFYVCNVRRHAHRARAPGVLGQAGRAGGALRRCVRTGRCFILRDSLPPAAHDRRRVPADRESVPRTRRDRSTSTRPGSPIPARHGVIDALLGRTTGRPDAKARPQLRVARLETAWILLFFLPHRDENERCVSRFRLRAAGKRPASSARLTFSHMPLFCHRDGRVHEGPVQAGRGRALGTSSDRPPETETRARAASIAPRGGKNSGSTPTSLLCFFLTRTRTHSDSRAS